MTKREIDEALHKLEGWINISVDFDSPEYPELLSSLEERGIEDIFSLAGIILSALK